MPAHNDGPADEHCDECGRYVGACNANPCIPETDEKYDRA